MLKIVHAIRKCVMSPTHLGQGGGGGFFCPALGQQWVDNGVVFTDSYFTSKIFTICKHPL